MAISPLDAHPIEVEDETFLVVNGSHFIKMATAGEIAAAAGVPPKVAADELAAAVDKGWVMNADGKYRMLPTARRRSIGSIRNSTSRCARSGASSPGTRGSRR